MTQKDNPLLQLRDPIPFRAIRAEHLEPAADALIEQALAELDSIASAPPSYATTLLGYERASLWVDRAATVMSHLESAATTPEYRAAYEKVAVKLSGFETKKSLHRGMADAVEAVASSDAFNGLEEIQKRHVTWLRDNYRRRGASLPDDEKAKLEAVDEELARACTKFASNVLDATNDYELLIEDEAALAGLPESALRAAAHSAKAKGKSGYRITLHAPSLLPAMRYLDDEALREKLWRASMSRASGPPFDNRPLIATILELRRRRAEILGFRDHADLVLSDRMAKSGERAKEFLSALRKRTENAFEREKQELRDFCKAHGKSTPIEPWDISYWAEKKRRAEADFDEELLRPYFSLDAVLKGVFDVSQRLFGVRIERGPERPTWHDTVQVYSLFDERDVRLATFYVDPFPRDSKRPGAWMHGLVTGTPDDPTAPEPHVGLFCGNFTEPTDDTPALLTHREACTVFHEFGHLLHHCVSRVDVPSLAGTRVAWDFVELPSQLMENWCWEKEALDLFARHYKTGEPLPAELYNKLVKTRIERAAASQMTQIGYASVDLALHCDLDRQASTDPDRIFALAREIAAQHSTAQIPDDFAMIASFGHLFSDAVGYAAGYYSYKWAEVLDADVFTAFKERDVFDEETGRRFRKEILEQGNGRDPGDLFRAFRGRDPNQEALFARLGLA